MRISKNLLVAGLWLAGVAGGAHAQHHDESEKYVTPADPLVQQKLAEWKKLKFGLMMHWGTYSIWGIVESWSLCPEDEGWCVRRGPYSHDWHTYKQAYEGLQKQFNPVKFDPDRWAAAAADAGMKYLVFTTKHHDGFCMFDTRQTDYRITHSSTPFSTHPKANITKEVFEAFRKKGFMTGAYFSKPDWHTPDYWWKYFPPKDRNVSYDPKKYPERWQAYKDFTYRQIEELATGYGRVDILWLDGGWVRPKETINPAVDWQRTIPYSQDIDMARIAAMARKHQPGMLVVDRTVAGEFENYTTPEQTVPKNYLPYPWESCITLGNSWSYVPGDQYKSARTVIHMLTNIVSRNGSLLLNVGPSPDGEWDPKAYARLQEIGSWMKINGEAIHDTEADPKLQGKTNWVFTKKDNAIYAIYQLPEGTTELPNGITVPLELETNPKQVSLLGSKAKVIAMRGDNGLSLQWKKGTVAPCENAWVFKVSQ